jgi:hypothetical protein
LVAPPSQIKRFALKAADHLIEASFQRVPPELLFHGGPYCGKHPGYPLGFDATG